VAVVASADFGRLAQLRPGDEVWFQDVSVEEARRLKREQDERLARRCAEIRVG